MFRTWYNQRKPRSPYVLTRRLIARLIILAEEQLPRTWSCQIPRIPPSRFSRLTSCPSRFGRCQYELAIDPERPP